jgi:hypothetical protein
MHIQARASKNGAGFIDDEGAAGQSVAISASYGRGVLSELLGHLDDAGFNLRAASGHDIELGGEFAFWVNARRDQNGDPIDANHDEATRRAAELLEGEGWTVDLVEVHRRKLTDEPGALRAFVDEVRDNGLLVREVSVGTADAEGRVPVQIFTVATPG